MTKVLVTILRPAMSGDRPASGPVDFSPSRRRVEPDAVVLPSPFTVHLDDRGQVLVELTPTGPGWCWRVVERAPDGAERFVVVPDVAGTVDYSALVDVDPTTLDPAATPEAAWWSALEARGQGLAPGLAWPAAGGTLVTTEGVTAQMDAWADAQRPPAPVASVGVGGYPWCWVSIDPPTSPAPRGILGYRIDSRAVDGGHEWRARIGDPTPPVVTAYNAFGDGPAAALDPVPTPPAHVGRVTMTLTGTTITVTADGVVLTGGCVQLADRGTLALTGTGTGPATALIGGAALPQPVRVLLETAAGQSWSEVTWTT